MIVLSTSDLPDDKDSVLITNGNKTRVAFPTFH